MSRAGGSLDPNLEVATCRIFLADTSAVARITQPQIGALMPASLDGSRRARPL
jgi:hypothetical protein